MNEGKASANATKPTELTAAALLVGRPWRPTATVIARRRTSRERGPTSRAVLEDLQAFRSARSRISAARLCTFVRHRPWGHQISMRLPFRVAVGARRA